MHRRVQRTLLMRFSSLTRAIDRTATACSLQTQAGASAGQAAQSAVQRSPPSVTHIIGYYSFNQPRRDGRLSWPCWLTDSKRRTHKVVKQPSISLAQDEESPLARIDVQTTMLCHRMDSCWWKSDLQPKTLSFYISEIPNQSNEMEHFFNKTSISNCNCTV